MSSRAKRHRHMDMEKNRPRADAVEENELRGSQLSSVSQISTSRSTFHMIYMVGFGL
jgi:hypothetical protein